jgi:hypothetical protein
MSQRAVEQVLGRLVTDEGFLEAFLADPRGTAARAGLDLSPKELHALTRIPRAALASLCASVDDRICRLYVPGRPGAETEEGHR